MTEKLSRHLLLLLISLIFCFELFTHSHCFTSGTSNLLSNTATTTRLYTANTTKVASRNPKQCSCPNCGCNGQTPCPKPIPANSYVVLAAIENCQQNNMIPGVGLVNIQTTSADDKITSFLVDEDNKNKAMSGQPFSYIIPKSQSEFTTCVQESSSSVRFPSLKLYAIARSSNAVLNANVIFNIQMSCVVSPYTSISFGYRPRGEFPRIYVGVEMEMSFLFQNEFNQHDTWQDGVIKSQDGRLTAIISGGDGNLLYKPVKEGKEYFNFRYTPNLNVNGGSPFDLPTQEIEVYKMADSAVVNINSTVNKREFTVDYLIKDNDGTVTPLLDFNKLTFTDSDNHSPKFQFNCAIPPNSGKGSVTCAANGVGTTELVLKYDGRQIGSSASFTIVDDNPGNSGNDYRFLLDIFLIVLIVGAPILLCICLICLVIVGIVFCIKRRRNSLKEENSNLLGGTSTSGDVVV